MDHMDDPFDFKVTDSHKWQVHEDRQWNEESWKTRGGQRKVVSHTTAGVPTYSTHEHVTETTELVPVNLAQHDWEPHEDRQWNDHDLFDFAPHGQSSFEMQWNL